MRWLQALLSIATSLWPWQPVPLPLAAPDGDGTGAAAPRQEVGVEVEFAPSCTFRGIRANQIYSALLALGEIPSFFPNFVVAADEEMARFWLVLETDAPWDAIAAAVRQAVGEGEITAVRTVSPEMVREAAQGGGAEPAEGEREPPAGGTGAAPATAPDVQDSAVEQRTIRVDLDRLEALRNLVGELAVEKAHLANLSARLEALCTEGESRKLVQELRRSVGKLAAVSGQLQELATELRMVPVGALFQRFPRLVRDLATATGKRLVLQVEGGETLLDKAIVEEMADPLLHLIRNAADHGIEMPAERRRAGKPETGTITLRAYDQGDQVFIEVEDDGRGMDVARIRARAVERGLVPPEVASQLADEEVLQFVFHPGFSTAEQVTDLSGRGVGMDVVKAAVERLRGSVRLRSTPGGGTRVTLCLPLTVSVLPVLLAQVSGQTVAVPMNMLLGLVRVPPEERVLWKSMFLYQGRLVPLVDLAWIWWQEQAAGTSALVVSGQGGELALLVDRVLGQGEVVVKPLGEFVGRIPGIAGGAILADGRVALVLDPASLQLDAAARKEGTAVGPAIAAS